MKEDIEMDIETLTSQKIMLLLELGEIDSITADELLKEKQSKTTIFHWIGLIFLAPILLIFLAWIFMTNRKD